jgi:hypothetical protein
METTTTPQKRPPEAARTTNDDSLPALIRELRDETTTLLRQEVQLAKAEMSEKASRLTRNAMYLVLGGMIAYAGLVVLLIAARDLLFVALSNNGVAAETALWVAPLIVGVLIGIIGWAMVAKGKRALAHEGIAPEKTIESLREDKNWLQQRTKQKLQRT